MSTSDILPCFIVMMLATLATIAASSKAPSPERELVRGSMALHFVSSFTLLWVMDYVFGVSDTHVYLAEAKPLIALLEQRFGDTFVDILRLIVNQSTHLPGYEEGGGSSASMVGVSALTVFFANGSVWAVFVALGYLGFLGKWALYAGLRDEMPEVSTRSLAYAVLLFPSVVFWTSGLVKETFALAGIGFLFRSVQLLRRGPNVFALVVGAVGFALVASFKPYLLFPFAVGARSWFVTARSTRFPLLNPLLALLAIAVSVVAIAALGKIFPEFAADKVAESAAKLQSSYSEGGGGSNFEVIEVEDRSTAMRVALAPVALFTALARPLIFEAHNVSSFITAFETLVVTVLAIQTVRTVGIRATAAAIMNHRALGFCAVFVVIAATAIGMATSNFGTLARYRAPLLPMYAALIIGVRAVAAAAQAKERPAAEPAPAVAARVRGAPRRNLRGLGWLR
ncbi:MAG: hypothetical protein R3B36_03690 [Polyangiaceae bacterium]